MSEMRTLTFDNRAEADAYVRSRAFDITVGISGPFPRIYIDTNQDRIIYYEVTVINYGSN